MSPVQKVIALSNVKLDYATLDVDPLFKLDSIFFLPSIIVVCTSNLAGQLDKSVCSYSHPSGLFQSSVNCGISCSCSDL